MVLCIEQTILSLAACSGQAAYGSRSKQKTATTHKRMNGNDKAHTTRHNPSNMMCSQGAGTKQIIGQQHQASTTIFSCPSDAFSLSDLFDETDARLTLRGGFTTSFFSGDPSLILRDLNADRVRFLLCGSAGLDDSSRPVPASFNAAVGVSVAVVRGSTVVSRIVLKKSRAATRALLSFLLFVVLVYDEAQLTLSRR